MKRYFTTDKTGDSVEVDRETALELIRIGKKKAEDFEVEDNEEQPMQEGPSKPEQNAPPETIGKRIAGAAFPRTMKAAEEGEEYPIFSGILDAASLPGRALMGAASALGQEGEGLVGRLLASTGRTQSTSNFLPVRLASDVLRAPETVLIPGVASAAGRVAGAGAQLLKSPAIRAGVTEAGRVAGEGYVSGVAAGNSEGRGFSFPGAVVGAAPGAAFGAKTVLDAPAVAAYREMTQPEISKALYSVFMPNKTMSQGSPILRSPKAFEEQLFKPSEYADAPMKDVQDWEGLESGIREKVSGIAKKELEATSSDAFSQKVPVSRVVSEVKGKPGKSYADKKKMRSQTITLENNLKEPLYDIIDQAASVNGVPLTDAEILQIISDIESGVYEGQISIRDLVKMKKDLNAIAKENGKYKGDRVDRGAAQAYDSAYQSVNQVIRDLLPETPETQAYFSANRAYAQTIPFREALENRFQVLQNLKSPDQTSVGRVENMIETALTSKKGSVKDALTKKTPPRVTIGNAWQLYQSSPAMVAAAEKAAQQGGLGYTGGMASRFAPMLLRRGYDASQEEEEE